MVRSFLLCLCLGCALLAGAGCHSVTEATQSREEYTVALKHIQADAGAALKEFGAKMSGSVGAKEGAKLRDEATSAFRKDMEEAKYQLRALKPPLDAMGAHLKALGVLEAAEKIGTEVSRSAKSVTAESLKGLAKQMEKAAGELGKAGEKVGSEGEERRANRE